MAKSKKPKISVPANAEEILAAIKANPELLNAIQGLVKPKEEEEAEIVDLTDSQTEEAEVVDLTTNSSPMHIKKTGQPSRGREVPFEKPKKMQFYSGDGECLAEQKWDKKFGKSYVVSERVRKKPKRYRLKCNRCGTICEIPEALYESAEVFRCDRCCKFS